MKPGLSIHFFDNAVGERKDKELLVNLLRDHYHIEVVNELTRRRTNFGPPKRSDKQIKTKKSLTKSFGGYAHLRCHEKYVKEQIYIPCA